jgi:DNA polymerase III epsilon subunit-like protein
MTTNQRNADLNQLLFFDLETGGLNEKKSCILEFGALVVDPISLEVLEEYETKVKPRPGADLHPKALEVNGYTEEAWKDAPTWQHVVKKFYQLMSGRTLGGHNIIEFDWLWMAVLFGMANAHMVIFERDWNTFIDGAVDTLKMAKNKGIPGMKAGSNSLWNLALMLEVVKPEDSRGKHKALNDCYLALGVYKGLMARYGQAR